MDKKKIVLIAGGALLAAAVALVLLLPTLRLKKAEKLEAQNRFEEALIAYERWNGADAAERMDACRRHQARYLAGVGDYDGGYAILTAMNDPDAALLYREGQAAAMAEAHDYEGAVALLETLEGDEREAILRIRCDQAQYWADTGEYEKAVALFEELDRQEELLATRRVWALAMEEAEDWKTAYELFRLLPVEDEALREHYLHVCESLGMQAVAEGNAWDGVNALWELREAKPEAFAALKQVSCVDYARAVTVSGGKVHTAWVRRDGTVAVAGSNAEGQADTQAWTQVVSVAVGDTHTLALRADGTCVAAGGDHQGQCRVSGWKNVKQIAAGAYVSVGLTADGRVLVTPNQQENMQEAASWTDVVDIAAGYDFILGLKADGTVLVCTPPDYKQVTFEEGTRAQRVFAGDFLAALVQKDGSLILGGSSAPGEMGQAMAGWKKVAYLATCMGTAVGKTTDGKILVAGRNENKQSKISCDDPCQVATNGNYVLVSLPDGTAAVSGGEHTLDWQNIRVWE